MPEFRKDPITNRWVIIATERAKRPQSNAGADQHTEAGPCPFCAGNEAMTPPAVRAYRDDSTSFDWTVRVVPNKYPALVDNGDGSLRQDGIFESMNGLGIHEVVIESPEHVVDLATLTVQRFNRCLLVYRDRMLTLRADPRWRYILVYKNQGATAGATLPHIHSQLTALPMVPPAVIEAVKSAKRYHGDTGHCLFCDIIARNTAQPTRLVAQSERFVVLSPYAPRFPYETWILPRQHGAYFDSASALDYGELARILRETLLRISRHLDHPGFNYMIHSKPDAEIVDDAYHWQLQIIPKLTQVAGFEWGSGCFINPVAPEDAARLLREVTL